MRVLHIVRNLEIGGLERGVVDLSMEQVRQGNAAAICELTGSRGSCFDAPAGVELYGPPARETRMARFGLLMAALKRFQPDVVHVHNTLSLQNSLLPCMLRRRPVLLAKHGMVFQGGLRGWLYRWPRHVVCVSTPIRGKLITLHPACQERSSVIPNGITMQDPGNSPRETWRQKLNLDTRTRAFVWVGRFVEEKGLDLLLRAFAKLADNPGWTLFLIGDGPLRADIEAQANTLNIGARVRFTGMRQDIRELLPAFDVFVLPSLSEGLPMALLEAASAGLPLIVSDAGDMPTVVCRQNGWVVKAGDEAMLGDCLGRACRAETALLHEMGDRSLLVAGDLFSLQACAARYEYVYRKVAGCDHSAGNGTGGVS